MLSENIVFKDLHKVQIITPYRQLRNAKGWTQDYAADRLCISKRLLIDIELGHCDCPKSVVRIMDREYGCGGQLIAYWLTKFSIGPDPAVLAGVKMAAGKIIRRFYKNTL